MFQGTELLTLDEKGRLALPKRLRAELAGRADRSVVVTRHPDGCLMLYPASAWPEVRDRLAALPYSARALQRIVLGGALEVPLDRAGRVLVPAGLRALAGLQREVALVGLGNRMELWDRERLAASEEALSEGLSAQADAFRL